MAVGDPTSVHGQDRLVATHHVALPALGVGLVLDGQGAHQHLRVSGGTGGEVGLPADEVGCLDPRAGQPRLQRVVLALQLGAHQAVALLEASGRAVHATAGRSDAQVGTGLHEGVPQLRAILPAGVHLPTGVAHIRDPEQLAGQPGHLCVDDGTVWRALLAEVLVGQLGQHRRRPGAPESERGELLRDVRERHRAIGRHVATGPELVPPTIEYTGHDAHAVLAQAHHREVRVEAAVRGQPRGVDRSAHRHVHLVDGQAVGVLHGSRTLQLVDLEGTQVDHATVLTQVEVLTDGDRTPPPVVPLDLTLREAVTLHQVGVAAVPLRPLPGAGLEELGSQVLLAGEVGADLEVAAPLPLLGGVDDAVGLDEVLVGARPDVLLGAFLVVEAGYVGTVYVDHPGVAVGHPLGDDLGHSRTLLYPYGGRRPEVPYLRGLAQARHGVRREGEEAVDGVPDLRLAQHVHQLDGRLHLRIEVVIGERHLGRREGRLLVGRDLVRVVEDRPVAVRADLHGAGRLPLVAEGVHVPDDRVADLVVGLGQDVHRADVGHLVDGGDQRDGGTGHVGDPVGPDSAGDHDVFGRNGALVRDDRRHGGHATLAIDGLDVEDLGIGEHLAAGGLDGLPTHRGAGLQRVDHRDGRAVEATQDDVLVDEGHQLLHLRRREQAGLDAPGPGRRHPAVQLQHPILGASHLYAPAVHREVHVPVLVGALLSEQGHLLVVVHREDEVGGVTGGTTGVGQGALVQQDHVGPAETGEVADKAIADDACSDHDDIGASREVTHSIVLLERNRDGSWRRPRGGWGWPVGNRRRAA